MTLRPQGLPSSPTDSLRAQLLGFGTEFVAAVSVIPGVRRVALIGSLTTAKPDPKDIDFLVEITDDVDLARLARWARRLQGRAQALNRGADVFLVGPEGMYLGRTCYWRECRRGRRASCDARHCGQRPHLHDDLDMVNLPPSLVTAPPAEVWPELVIRTNVPPDVEDWLASLNVPAP